jgi:hypothetical protein
MLAESKITKSLRDDFGVFIGERLPIRDFSEDIVIITDNKNDCVLLRKEFDEHFFLVEK